MKILLTGVTGFTGARLAQYILDSTAWEIYSLERVSSRPRQIEDSPRIHHLYHDFRAEIPERILKELNGVDYIIHTGAEVHGLRSLENPELFVHNNVMGTLNMLEAARRIKPKAFLYLSSAEAVGSAAEGSLIEDAPMRPSNPYAASKAAGEMLIRTYFLSFGVPAMTVRTMNIFGEKQDTSKFLPATIKKMLSRETVVCHVDERGNSGSRHWIYVGQLVSMMLRILECGTFGETYHVVGPEISNIKIIRYLEQALGLGCKLALEQPGPSHDMRYSIKDTKLYNFYDTGSTEPDLIKVAWWYQKNQEWLR